jgi:hypothetical protein
LCGSLGKAQPDEANRGVIVMKALFKKKYKPPKQVDGFEDIKTSQIMTLWSYINPRLNTCQVGDKVTIPMKSGKVAIYELIEKDFSTHWSSDVDWEWYILRFVGYSS